jgi:hypothetical protein
MLRCVNRDDDHRGPEIREKPFRAGLVAGRELAGVRVRV